MSQSIKGPLQRFADATYQLIFEVLPEIAVPLLLILVMALMMCACGDRVLSLEEARGSKLDLCADLELIIVAPSSLEQLRAAEAQYGALGCHLPGDVEQPSKEDG